MYSLYGNTKPCITYIYAFKTIHDKNGTRMGDYSKLYKKEKKTLNGMLNTYKCVSTKKLYNIWLIY